MKKKFFILTAMITFCFLCSICFFACGNTIVPESISFIYNDGSPLTEITIFRGNYSYVHQYLSITPEDATGYTLQWSSSSYDKVSISFTKLYEVRIDALEYTEEPVTITCQIKDTDIRASFLVNVTDGELQNIIVDSSIANTTFYEGQTFDKNSLIVWGYFQNGQQHLLNNDELDVEVDNPLKIGSVLKIKYENFEITQQLNVVEDSVVSLNIENYPKRLNYTIGEHFDPEGLVVRGTFASGKNEIINDYTFENRPFAYDDNSIVISYNDHNISIPLNISATTTVFSFNQLQEAVNNANVGDSICISGKEYSNVSTLFIPISKNLTIFGSNENGQYTKIKSSSSSAIKLINDSLNSLNKGLTIANLDLYSSGDVISFDDENSLSNINGLNLVIENIIFNVYEGFSAINFSTSDKFSPSQISSLSITIENCTFAMENNALAITFSNVLNSNIYITNSSSVNRENISIIDCQGVVIEIDGNLSA